MGLGGSKRLVWMLLGVAAVVLFVAVGAVLWFVSATPEAPTEVVEVSAAEEPELPAGALLQLSTAEIDFGDISQDTTVGYVLEVTNGGSKALIIRDIESS